MTTARETRNATISVMSSSVGPAARAVMLPPNRNRAFANVFGSLRGGRASGCLFGRFPDWRRGAAAAGRQIEQVGGQLIEEGEDFGRWDEVGVFGVHIA